MFQSGLQVLLDFAGCRKGWGAVLLFLMEEGVLGFSREGQMGLRNELQWGSGDLKQLSRRKRAFYFQGTPLLWRPESSSAFCCGSREQWHWIAFLLLFLLSFAVGSRRTQLCSSDILTRLGRVWERWGLGLPWLSLGELMESKCKSWEEKA